MRTIESITKEELTVLLNKCWMTHDGMWFFNCLREYGIEAANKLNKSAIEFLAPLEVARLKKLFGAPEEFNSNFKEFKTFFNRIAKLFIPDFMGGEFKINDDHTMDMMMRPGECFAYKGIKRLGVIENYECGVFFRIECWMRTLGLEFETDKPSLRCLFHHEGQCQKQLKFINFIE
ncbi:hypothetical protein KKA14_17400 [bacterium]|nr:hypothetical protein [bacterium]